MTSTVDDFMPNSFNEGKLNTAIEITEVSEDLVKIYLDHSKHLHYSKDLRSQSTIEKR